jgi:hypothetical protein
VPPFDVGQYGQQRFEVAVNVTQYGLHRYTHFAQSDQWRARVDSGKILVIIGYSLAGIDSWCSLRMNETLRSLT